MREIIDRIQRILNQMKGFEVGTSTASKDKMILDYNEKRYLITIREMENPSEDIFKDIDLYLG